MMASRHEMQLQQGKATAPMQINSSESPLKSSIDRKGILVLRRRGRPVLETKELIDRNKDIFRNKQIKTEVRRNNLKNKSPLIFHQGNSILWSEQSPPSEPSVLHKNKSVHLPSPFTQPVTQQLSLKRRAKEFVSFITKEKTQLKGRYFLIRQQEEQRKKIRTEIEEYEKSMIVGKYREGRRLRAQKKIQILKQRAQQRQKIKNSRISEKRMTLAEPNEETTKEKLKHGNVTFHPYEIAVKPPRNNTKINKLSEQSQDVLLHTHQSLKRIEQAKKMLSQLNRLILRQEHLVRQERQLTFG